MAAWSRMLLRDLRVPLAQIGDILAGQTDEVGALRQHLELVSAQRDRLDRIAATIVRTLDELEGRRLLAEQDFFDGLDQRREELAHALRDRYGPAAANSMTAAAARTAHWNRADYARATADAEDLYGRLSRARQSGHAPTSPQTLDLVAEHYQAVRTLWPADAVAYHALADLIESDPRQRAPVAAVDVDLPAWLASAVRAYATQRLR